jgi:hypothetical protein
MQSSRYRDGACGVALLTRGGGDHLGLYIRGASLNRGRERREAAHEARGGIGAR